MFAKRFRCNCKGPRDWTIATAANTTNSRQALCRGVRLAASGRRLRNLRCVHKEEGGADGARILVAVDDVFVVYMVF